MVKEKYYAVRAGRKTGIFKTWNECEMQIKGFSGASYKRFATLEQAYDFLNIPSTSDADKELKNCAIAYVDGSYDHSVREFSYGVVMIYNGVTDFLLGKSDDKNLVEMRNVAGEIMGAKEAMKYCLENYINSVDIYHDYEGVAKWCTGEWKANKSGTIAYKNYYNEIKNKLNINFIKVQGHSGDKYNDIADQLAKNALGLATYPDI